MLVRRRNAEIVEGLVVIGISAFLFSMTWDFSESLVTMTAAPSPALIPRIVLVLLMALGAYRLVLAIITVPIDSTLEIPWNKTVWLTALIALAYVFASTQIGLALPAPLLCIAIACLWGGRNVWAIAAIAIGLPVFVWLVFVVAFGSYLPLFPSNL